MRSLIHHWLAAALVMAGLLSVGCNSTLSGVDRNFRAQRDSGPTRATDIDALAALPSPIARVEPRSRSGNRSPYRVLGKTYHLLARADGYRETGVASWYGRKFHGRQTASGEPYDMYALTAAHRSLPIPCYLEVTNLGNGRSVVVRVNDRGPFHGDRVIDLSFAAAVKLGFHDDGTARVALRYLVGPRQPGQSPPAIAASIDPRLFLQMGVFRTDGQARAYAQRVRAVLPEQVGIKTHHVGDQRWQVRMGPLADVEARRLRALLAVADLGFPKIVAGDHAAM